MTKIPRPWMTRKQAKQLRNKLETEYPTPIKVIYDHVSCKPDGKYCIGGAICWYSMSRLEQLWSWIKGTIKWHTYPVPDRLADALREINCDLMPMRAEYYAKLIIKMNDTGQFNRAWDYFEDAMGESYYNEKGMIFKWLINPNQS